MNKHVIFIAPHAAMTDCARFYNINMTIIDTHKNVRNYDALTNTRTFFYDYHDLSLSKKIVASINEEHPVDAIITLTEKALRIAAELSVFLRLPTLPLRVIDLIHDKYSMRTFLSDKDDFSIKFSQPNHTDELTSFAHQNGFPFIVKPVNGTGSHGVSKIVSHEQIQQIDFSNKVIAEAFLDGDEYSVECFSFNGNHTIVSITRKMLIESSDNSNFTEIGHCVPADLEEEKKSQIVNYINKFLTVIGIDNGPSHTEIKVSGNNIHVIETHNRIGGDRISSLVKISTGIDLVELSILWPLGLCSPINEDIEVKCHAAIRFFNPPCGNLISIIGREVLKHSPSVIDIEITCKPGDEITPIRESLNRYGFVIVTGKSESEAIGNSIISAEKMLFNISN